MVEADVYEVYTIEVEGVEDGQDKAQTAVVLKARDQERYLPIWVDKLQGVNIATGLRSIQSPRPMTFDLMVQLIEKLGGRVEAVHLNALQIDTFYATLRVAKNGTVEEIDCRPSDALALALRVSAPIYIDPDVLARAGQDVAQPQKREVKVPAKVKAIKPLEL